MDNVIMVSTYIGAIFSCIAPLVCLALAGRERQSRALSYFMIMVFSAFTTALGALLVLISKDIRAMMVAVKISYTGHVVCTCMIPIFMLEYTQANSIKWVKKLIVVLGVINMSMVFDTLDTNYFFKNEKMISKYGLTLFHCDYGTIYFMFLLEIIFIYVHMMIYMIHNIRKTRKGSRGKKVMLVIGILIPGIGVIFMNSHLTGEFDVLPFCMALSSIVFCINLIKYQMFDMTQNAKDLVVDNMEEAIAVTDEAYHVLYTNRVFSVLYPEIVTKKVIPEDYRKRKSGDEVHVQNRHFQLYKASLMNDNGIMQGYLFELHETTIMKERMAEVERLTEESNAANNAKGQFLASMSHEIRTPINAIIGMNEMILRENSEMQIAEYASNIGVAGRGLLSLINNILDYSKLENTEIEWVNMTYKVSELLQDLELKVYPFIEHKPVVFHIELADNIPSELFGDEVRVKQILMNLLTNAVKYTESGSVTLKIWMEDTKHEIGAFPGNEKELECKNMMFSVIDTGCGIKEEDLEQLFVSFQRIEEGKNRDIAGIGLGLTLTKKLLEHMDGTIVATSEYGKGSTFTVAMPQLIVNETPLKTMRFTYEADHQKKTDKKMTAPNARILIVDDNAVNLKVINGLLKRTKIQVVNAKSGKECLELARKEEFHLIFLDHQMPEMDGLQTFAAWKEMPDRLSKEIPVIALTANVSASSREQYMAFGFQDYLAKPVDAKELENILVRYLPMELVVIEEVGK